jgi:hypothetical protein
LAENPPSELASAVIALLSLLFPFSLVTLELDNSKEQTKIVVLFLYLLSRDFYPKKKRVSLVLFVFVTSLGRLPFASELTLGNSWAPRRSPSPPLSLSLFFFFFSDRYIHIEPFFYISDLPSQ